MIVKSLHLENFRNYRRLDIEVGPSVNVFYGKNAQGKTNIIEALYLCASVRSHRTSKDKEIIMKGQDYFKAKLLFCPDDQCHLSESVSLCYHYDQNEEKGIKKNTRIAKYNGVKLDRIAEYFGLFNAVIFAPEDLLLIKEGPSVRRRFIDILISQVRPRYFYDLQQYSRFLMQRNRLLKQLRASSMLQNSPEDISMRIEAWDLCMAPFAAEIIKTRALFLERLKHHAAHFHHMISDGQEELKLHYKTVSGVMTSSENNDLDQIEKLLLSKWKESHKEDIEKGNTSIGPHRDDIEMSLNDLPIRLYASQGQQRTSALSLKLSELMIVREETREMPVLLLDDVFSELDINRRTALLKSIGNAQVFITCTDRSFIEKELCPICPDLFEKKDNIRFFRILEGQAYLDAD